MSKRSRARNRQERRAQEIKSHEVERSGPAELATKLAEPAPLNGLLDHVGEIVDRADQTSGSRQPRFTSAQGFFSSMYRWVRDADLERPGQRATIRQWDEWFRKFAFAEDHLAGVLNSVVAIDKNRGWSITGGRNQVAKFTRILRSVDEGAGWRHYAAWQAQSYYTTRMGFVTEIGADGLGGPLRGLWSVDPVRCEMTGDPATPLRYVPTSGGGSQLWLPGDYFRAASLVSTDEFMRGVGWPAVARCILLAEIMLGVYAHDREALGARAPRGLLLLHGISQDDWNHAMEAREENLTKIEREYYGGVAVLATTGAEEIKAELMALSQLPKDFDLEVFTNLLMYGFALAFGYDPREFWPVSSGTLGTATETETQHRKASSKGDLDFSLAHQEQIQNVLPASLLFEYAQRDVEGEASDAALQLAKAQVIGEMTKWLINQSSVLTVDQVMQLAAQAGLIPEEWTIQEENVSGTDTDPEGITRALQREEIQQAVECFPGEPIVRYNYPMGTTYILAPRGEEALRRRSYPAFDLQRSIASVARKFHGDLRGLATLGFFSTDSILGAVRATVKQAVEDAYIEGLVEGGVTIDEMDAEDALSIVELNTAQQDHVTDFCRAVRAAKDDKAAQRDILDNRVNLWTASIEAAGAAGLASARKNEMVTWHLGPTEEHCSTCASLNGKSHRRKWFASRDYFPRKPGAAMECGGYKCQCTLEAA